MMTTQHDPRDPFAVEALRASGFLGFFPADDICAGAWRHLMQPGR